jgi:uncharacterized repeat protein (TIGR01451 family)
MEASEHERRDWTIVVIILLIGFLCVILAGQWALRFSPSWKLNANMGSNLDPNSGYLTQRSEGFIEPLDPSILTLPVWINVFLTPGASFQTRVPPPANTGMLPVFPPITKTPIAFPSATNTTMVFGNPTSTLAFFLPSSSTPNSPPPSTDVPIQSVDLQITKTDNVVVYTAGGTLIYTVTITNNGPGGVVNAIVTDNIPSQILNWSWACASQNNGASGCDSGNNGNTNFSDLVDLPSGASIVYTVTANITPGAIGDLSNIATINEPDGYTDPISENNSTTDTDDLPSSLPYGNIGSTPDQNTAVVPPGSSVTFTFDTPLIVDGHAGWDLVYYELPNGTGIAMDIVIVQISDGFNWYTILNWGDNIPNTNTNLDISITGGSEIDNRDFTTPPNSDILYPFNSGTLANPATGVVIELDGIVPNGIYPYIRIISPVGGDVDGGCEVDAIVIFP